MTEPFTAADQTVNDRPGPATHCPTELTDFTGEVWKRHGTVATFIGIAYLLTSEWEAVHCTKCQRVLRWATDEESVINAAERALGHTPPAIP